MSNADAKYIELYNELKELDEEYKSAKENTDYSTDAYDKIYNILRKKSMALEKIIPLIMQISKETFNTYEAKNLIQNHLYD